MLNKFQFFYKWNVVLVCLLFVLSSCNHSPRVIYDLESLNLNQRSLLVLEQVIILQPETKQALNNDLISVVTNDNEISYFADVSWSDDLPNLVHAKLVETFENSGNIVAGKRGQGISAKYRIATTITLFSN